MSRQGSSWQVWACLFALLGVTALAYRPILSADFVRFDDQYYVQENKQLRTLEGLGKIWDPRAVERGMQYYPLVWSSFWLEYQLWGLDARGYHATNLVFHMANALLVFFLVRALGPSRRVAFAVAGIFALHPVQVESVAWISERKNVLSGFFYLLAFLAYVRHRRAGSAAAYAGCLAAFVAALLSKTQTVTLPISILLVDWALQHTGRLPRTSAFAVGWRIAPLLAIGVAAAVVTIQAEGQHITPPAFTIVERGLLVANAAAFYVRLFLVPAQLAPIYPTWNLSAGVPIWWIAVTVWPAVLAFLVRFRREIGPLPLWGIVHFFVCLVPILGFVSFNYMIYSFVADHFLYLALIGSGLAAALLADRVARQTTETSKRQTAVMAIGALVLVGCAFQTNRETKHWRNNEAFWAHVHSRNPNDFGPNWNLGLHYRRIGLWEEALPFFERASQIWPQSDFAFRRYAQVVSRMRGPEAAIQACNAKLAHKPRFYAAYLERGANRERLKRVDKALRDYRRVTKLTRKGSDPWKEVQRRIQRLEKRRRGAGGAS